MQHDSPDPYPPPNVNPAWAQSTPPASSPSLALSQQEMRAAPPDIHSSCPHLHAPNPDHVAFQVQPQQTPQGTPPPQNPNFLIVGLFALRLTLQLISSLDPYPEQTGDIDWLKTFLAPYNTSFDLAKVVEPVKQAYLATYPGVVARMKVQRLYPVAFMALNPVTPQRREELARRGGMTDAERREIIDFADAAREWGSVVHVPEAEAKRMVDLADQRLIADLK